MEPRAEIKEF